MKTRCYNVRSSAYPLYGGRGIVMCDQWRESFEAFYADMGDRPSTLHTIDRRDNDGPYNRGNCHWSTPKQQANNTRTNRRLTLNGVTRTLTEWADTIGIKRTTLKERLRRGWSVHLALTTPGTKLK